jgi:hypothetical protein
LKVLSKKEDIPFRNKKEIMANVHLEFADEKVDHIIKDILLLNYRRQTKADSKNSVSTKHIAQ